MERYGEFVGKKQVSLYLQQGKGKDLGSSCEAKACFASLEMGRIVGKLPKEPSVLRKQGEGDLTRFGNEDAFQRGLQGRGFFPHQGKEELVFPFFRENDRCPGKKEYSGHQ